MSAYRKAADAGDPLVEPVKPKRQTIIVSYFATIHKTYLIDGEMWRHVKNENIVVRRWWWFDVQKQMVTLERAE